MTQTYKWILTEAGESESCKDLAHNLSIHPKLAFLLTQRNITRLTEAQEFFNPHISNTHSPFEMKGMEQAASRIIQALEAQEKILVYGDYDVDGTTAVACMYQFLLTQSSFVEFYVPDRYAEGYGVSMEGISYAIENNISLIITLDCGIKAHTTIAYATQHAIDVIVCDHHEPDEILPPALAILNPKQKDCTYPCKALSGCGVGFKLIHALCLKLQLPLKENLYVYLDLLAVSIACDIVPITGENRIFMHYGLRKLQEKPLKGLQAMLATAGIQNIPLSVADVVFKIGPRINAAGRIFNARKAIELLIAHSYDSAMELCSYIDDFNNTRKDIDKTITEEAIAMIESDSEHIHTVSTVLYKDTWHKGVIGIVASRVIESYYKPSIIFCGEGDVITGSARSVQGFNIYTALEKCEKHILHFGGHMYAAGLSIEKNQFSHFKIAFENAVAESITEEQKQARIYIDTELNLPDITPQFYSILSRFGPFGPENMTPVFLMSGLVNAGYTRSIGKEHAHLKVHLTHPDCPEISIQGIGFGLAHKWKEIQKTSQSIDCCFVLRENTFRGKTSIEIELRDIRASVI